jgi:Uncharacterized ACR, COG1678
MSAMSKSRVLRLIAMTILASCAGLAQAAEDLSKTLILVAKPELRADPVFGSGVLVVTPIGGNQHAGDQEIEQGLWYVLDADPALILPTNTEGLWEELARRSKIAAEAI